MRKTNDLHSTVLKGLERGFMLIGIFMALYCYLGWSASSDTWSDYNRTIKLSKESRVAFERQMFSDERDYRASRGSDPTCTVISKRAFRYLERAIVNLELALRYAKRGIGLISVFPFGAPWMVEIYVRESLSLPGQISHMKRYYYSYEDAFNRQKNCPLQDYQDLNPPWLKKA